MEERIPAEVFPPGEFLADELEARGWTQSEFAGIIRRPAKLVNEIIAGRKAITPETAREFAAALGTSPQFWLNLENAYQLWKTAPLASARAIAQEAKLRERFPVRQMVQRGWLMHSENFEVFRARIFRFYGIADETDEPQLCHAARRNYREGLSILQEAWLFRVKQLASALKVSSYSEKKLREAIQAPELLLREPEQIRQVPEILADCGVRFVIVEPIPNSKIDGACFWINQERSPVIGLTLKWDYIDRFWFNLRHEIEHALRGDGKSAVIVDEFDSEANQSDESERAVNAVAAEFCVPQKMLEDFILRHDPVYSMNEFLGFSARIVKRHPGIVAGQLQHKTGRNSLFNKFKPRIREIITQTALTDGYGHTAPLDV
jgi:HTH-type transcriptional regulator / antitoxin HigA